MRFRGRVARDHMGARDRIAGTVYRNLARVQGWVYLFGAVLLEKDAEQLKSCYGNDQKAAGDANHKGPSQQVSDDGRQESKHVYRPRALSVILSSTGMAAVVDDSGRCGIQSRPTVLLEVGDTAWHMDFLNRAFLRVSFLWLAAMGGAICPYPAVAQSPEVAVTPKPITYLAPNKANYLKIAAESEAMLRQDVLGVWFLRTVDHEHGGFYSDFARDWQRTESHGKFSVFQGRMTWIAAQIVIRRPDLKDQYLPIVQHGMKFLNDVMWDKQYGGFFWGLDDNGQITPAFSDGKELYGISFDLYGAAAAHEATHDPRALELAQKTFLWIDQHAHDATNGGYFEWLTRDGTVVQGKPDAVTLESVPRGGFLIGYKSMNTHIHLLESLTQLYEVWKDDKVRQRLEEMLALVRDKICVQPGVMNLFFTNDWRPIPDHDSYGHDVETAYLMLEAEDVLGHGHDPRTERMAKLLVDHALANGWDETYGGFFEDGTTFGKPENKSKSWWVQMEGLNSLLLMHEKYGRETDVYFKAFQRQWQFIRDYQIDAKFHGVYPSIGPDGIPLNTTKGEIWKAAYHDGRALLNVTARLQRLAGAAQ